MDMEPDEVGFLEHRYPSTAWLPSEFAEKFGSVSLDGKEEIMRNRELTERNMIGCALRLLPTFSGKLEHFLNQYQLVSTLLFLRSIRNSRSTSEVEEKRLKERFEEIPTLDELHALELEGLGADVILVDAKKDKKLPMLKQLIVALVKGLNSNPAVMIFGLVSDVYKRPNSELSHAKAALEEASQISDNQGVQMLGQIKHSSSCARAILFKLLADTVGLESRLVVGLPAEGASECAESYKHISILVVVNSVELLAELVRFPGQLIPRTTKAIFLAHIAAGESDSAENDSCDSPLEPNSPLYGFSERNDTDSSEKDDTLQYQRRFEASSNAPGPSLRNMMLQSNTSIDRKLSPEHPSFRAYGWSMLSGDNKTFRDYSDDVSMLSGYNKTFRDYSDDVSTSRSEGAPTSETRRIRKRSISVTPEIGEDIVRAMNEALKQNQLLKEQGENSSYHRASSNRDGASDLKKDGADEFTESNVITLISPRVEEAGPRKKWADRMNDELVSTRNRVLESYMYRDKPLLPFEEWNIDFSELTVGTRVGIGFFGEVFRGKWNGTEVAIKVFLEQDLTAENMEDFCNEISVLSRVRYPNVMLFLGACAKLPHLSMVTEYMEMGSLYHLIHVSGQKNRLSWQKRLNMLRDICRGLMCLHRMKIVHRDLKSANCLVNKRWTVKICDFGLSRIMTNAPTRDSTSAGTPEWMAPELIRNEPFTEKCDIFLALA